MADAVVLQWNKQTKKLAEELKAAGEAYGEHLATKPGVVIAAEKKRAAEKEKKAAEKAAEAKKKRKEKESPKKEEVIVIASHIDLIVFCA